MEHGPRTAFYAVVFLSAVAACGCGPHAPPVTPAAETTRPGQFPAAVHIKTPARSFNLFFYFALDARGRIWVKSIPGASQATEKVAPDWRLFLGTGLPHDSARKDFVSPRRIESIRADQDELMAVSDDHRHYSVRWFQNPVFKEDTPAQSWADLHGWPVPGPFVWDARVARNRGWALGRRTRNFVLFEDAAGRTFDGGGGLSTYYFLTEDGTSIAFSDSGLPPDFSHTICGPDRSTFVAEAMDVSADTIFVINAHGEMRTRLVDFDTNGADTMFFVYSYDWAHLRPDAIAIPAEDWFAHKPVPLEGQAQISTNITIALTGMHNRDRELRVAGYDRDRRPGYWRKRIFEQADNSPRREDRDQWTFMVDETAPLEPERLLDPADTDPDPARARRRSPVPLRARPGRGKPPRRVGARDMIFEGELRVAGKAVQVSAQVPDFHLDCSPARVRLGYGGDAVEVVLHTVEKWYHLARFDPGHDGTPKELEATLEIPPAALDTKNPVLRALVTDVLLPYHLQSFALRAQATEEYLEVASKTGHAPRVELLLGRRGRAYPSLPAARRHALRQDALSRAAREARLQVGASLGELTAADVPKLAAKIVDNQRAEQELAIAADEPERQDRRTPGWLSGAVLGSLSYAAKPWLAGYIMPALPFRNVAPQEAAYYASNLATNMPPHLARNRALKDMMLGYVKQDLERAMMIIETRVAAYRRRLEELRGKRAAAPFLYSEELEGFWAPFRFGEREATLAAPAGGVAAGCRFTVSDRPMLDPAARVRFSRPPGPPGLAVDVACGAGGRDGRLGLAVTPTQLERDAFRLSLHRKGAVGSAANPLLTRVLVQVEHADTTPTIRALLDAVLRTKDQAAAQELPAQLAVEGDRVRVFAGKGFVLEWRR